MPACPLCGRGIPTWASTTPPRTFNLWYFFGVLLPAGAGQPAPDRYLADHELHPQRRGRRFRLRRVHHARRGIRLDAALHAFHRRLGVLRGGLPAYVPRAAVRVLQEAARADLDFRHADLRCADGGGLCRLCAALGTDVLLGRPGDHFPVRGDPRGSARTLSPGFAATS